MLALKESYSAPIEDDLLRLFWDVFYAPLLAASKIQTIRTNAAEAYIIAAIKSGKVKYADGKFSGDFDVRTSRELSSFASFNRRTKVWTGNPSPAIKAASILADTHRRELQARLEKAIDSAEANINQTVQSLSFGSDLPLFDMAEDIKKDLYSVGVMPEIDARTEKTLREQYTNNMRLNIVDEADSSKGWAPEQITRLRDMVKEYQTTGTNESLRALIEREWDTSRAKAKFLATQETRLFLDTLSRDRARRTGVRRYRWSTSHDEKVRQSHKLLDGKIVDIDGPGEIVDLKTGRRAHAGQDFGCRCAKIWVLEDITLKNSLTWSGYKLQGRTKVQGINISIENKKGSIRKGIDSDGHKWAIKMHFDYGYIRGTVGKDKDHLDCYIGPDKKSSSVFIIHQNNPDTGEYDEDKVMLGFNNSDEAKKAYLSQYDKPGFFGSMETMDIEKFKDKIFKDSQKGKMVRNSILVYKHT